ncbi:hypothetical protein IKN40_01375 [bacterium]|nr:hypothetical protein [bacterium]
MDSAVDLAIAAKTVSPEHIHAIYMPTKFNSNTSYELSKALTDNIGVDLKV